MQEPSATEAMQLCLVCDDPVVEAAVRASCPPPHRIDVWSREGLVDASRTLSAHGQQIVGAAREADAVLIDWSFDEAPAINTLCFHVRRSLHGPLLALCRGPQEASIASIAAGADDAVTFPLYPSFIQAKVFAYRRLVDVARAGVVPAAGGERPVHDVKRFGVLRLDRTAHRFFIEDQEVELTPREFGLLDFLIERADALCTRDQILDHVWGITFDTGTNMVDVYMYFLRKKLEAHGLSRMIQTVRGRGYRLVLPSETTDES